MTLARKDPWRRVASTESYNKLEIELVRPYLLREKLQQDVVCTLLKT